MANVFQLIRPKSISDSNYEAFEYLIRWTGRSGADYIYMFYDSELRQRTRSDVINAEDSDEIQSLISREQRTITLTASDLTQNELEIISEMFINPYVTRLKKDGTIERYAPDSTSIRYRLRDVRYTIEFDLTNYERPVYS